MEFLNDVERKVVQFKKVWSTDKVNTTDLYVILEEGTKYLPEGARDYIVVTNIINGEYNPNLRITVITDWWCTEVRKKDIVVRGSVLERTYYEVEIKGDY